MATLDELKQKATVGMERATNGLRSVSNAVPGVVQQAKDATVKTLRRANQALGVADVAMNVGKAAEAFSDGDPYQLVGHGAAAGANFIPGFKGLKAVARTGDLVSGGGVGDAIATGFRKADEFMAKTFGNERAKLRLQMAGAAVPAAATVPAVRPTAVPDTGYGVNRPVTEGDLTRRTLRARLTDTTPAATAALAVSPNPGAAPVVRSPFEGVDPNDMAGFRGMFVGLPQIAANAGRARAALASNNAALKNYEVTARVKQAADELGLRRTKLEQEARSENKVFDRRMKANEYLDKHIERSPYFKDDGKGGRVRDEEKTGQFRAFVDSVDPTSLEALGPEYDGMTLAEALEDATARSPQKGKQALAELRTLFDLNERFNAEARENVLGGGTSGTFPGVAGVGKAEWADFFRSGGLDLGDYLRAKLSPGTQNKVVRLNDGRVALYDDVVSDEEGQLDRMRALAKQGVR